MEKNINELLLNEIKQLNEMDGLLIDQIKGILSVIKEQDKEIEELKRIVGKA